MKKMLFTTLLGLSFVPFLAHADIFQLIKDGKEDEAVSKIQTLQDIEQKDEAGWTALMYAARLGQIKTAQALVEKGADLEVQNQAGLTPYLWAAYAGHVEMMKFLQEKGANIHHQNAYHENALDIATGMEAVESVKYILEATTDPAKKQEMAQNSIYLTKNEEIKALLINAGAVDIKKEEQETDVETTVNEENQPEQEDFYSFAEKALPEFAVMLAFAKNDEEKALAIIKNIEKINQDFRTANGWNLLSVATMNNSPRIIKTLIEKGFDVNDNKAEFKATALILALSHQKKDAALQLLRTPNIIVDYADEKGRNALDMIKEKNDAELTEALNNITKTKETVSSVTEHVNQEASNTVNKMAMQPAAQETVAQNENAKPSNATEENLTVDNQKKSPYSYHQ